MAGKQVTRDGTGLRGAWWRQIRQFNRVSPAMADAVVTAYPSPRLLQQVGPLPTLPPHSHSASVRGLPGPGAH